MTVPALDPSSSEAFDAPTYPSASFERRFYAFVIDRAIGWGIVAGAVLLMSWVASASVWSTVVVALGVWLLVGGVFALAAGASGISPGKALLGLRLVRHGTGTPVGAGAGLARAVILGVAGLPTLGLGVATLAWTATMDPGHQRRGWHDHRIHSIVVDVRDRSSGHQEEAATPRHIVNLTAMRLVPASVTLPSPPVSQPAPSAPRVPQPALPAQTPAQQPPPQPQAQAQPQPQPQPPPSTAAPRSGEPPRRTDDVGATVARRRPVSSGLRWRVSFDNGESFVVEGLGLIGRRPEARQGEPVRHLVPLPSGDMSLSKTHAQIHLAPDGVLVVMDRGSTNGSVLRRGKVSRVLSAGKPTTLIDGDRVRFGDREMSVVREA